MSEGLETQNSLKILKWQSLADDEDDQGKVYLYIEVPRQLKGAKIILRYNFR